MSKNSVDIEKIEAYLQGQMEEQEQSAFEAEMDAHPELKKEVDTYGQLFKGFKKMAFRKKVSALESELPNLTPAEYLVKESGKKNPGQPQAKVRRILYLSSAAAVLLFLVWILFFNPFQKNYTPIASALYALPDVKRMMSQEEDIKNYQSGITEFKNKDFPAAIDYFELIDPDNKYYINGQYLAGHSYFSLQQYSKAIASFLAVQQQIDQLEMVIEQDGAFITVSIEDVKWFLALSYLANKQNKQGFQLIDQISAEPNHRYFKQAVDIIQQQ